MNISNIHRSRQYNEPHASITCFNDYQHFIHLVFSILPLLSICLFLLEQLKQNLNIIHFICKYSICISN